MAIEESKNNEKTKNAPFVSLVILVLLPVVSLMLASAATEREREKERGAILAAQKEKDRIANALVWNIDTDPSLNEEEKKFVKEAANNAIKNEKQCVQLRIGGQNTIDKNAYYVQCVNSNDWSFNLYFTKEDVASGKPIKIEEPFEDASMVCYDAILDSAKFPETVSYKKLVDIKTFINGDTDVIQNFTAENKLGMDVRYQATCTVSKDGVLTNFSIE